LFDNLNGKLSASDDGMLKEARMAGMEQRVAYLEGRVEEHSQMFVDLRNDIRRLDDKISRQFLWLVGLQVTTLVAVLGAVFGAVVLVRG
jgi:hypothetical protein